MKVRRAATLDDAKRRCREMIRPGEMGGNPSIEDESIRVVLEALAGAEQTLVLRDLDRRFANDVCEAMRKHFPEHQASAVELIEKMAAESADLRARLERAEAAAESLTGVVRLAMKAVEARDCALTCSCGECEQCTALAITAGDLDRMATGVQPPPGYVPASEVRRAVEEERERLKPEWVVNSLAELGVKIGDRFFWLYKGDNIIYREPQHENGLPMLWRPVGKREFGECAHPINYADPTRVGTVSVNDGEEWKPLPPSNDPKAV